MQNKWLNKNNNSKLIIFFSGWGMDENSIKLNYENFDFLVFYDYFDEKINIALIEEIKKYNEIYLIAWSMGVVFSTLLNHLTIKKRIAINGTLSIIDDKFGIPTKIFSGTLNNLNKENIALFFQNMGYKDFISPNRTLKSQIDELKFIEYFCKNKEFKNNFDKIIIGNKDIIVPYKNQKRAWNIENVKIFDCGHYIFNLFQNWENILNV